MKLNKKIFLGVCLAGCYSSSFAVFGIGDIVFDPSVYATAGQQLNEGVKQGVELGRQTTNQLKQIEEMQQQYEQLKLQLESWRYDPIRNMTDVGKKMDTVLNSGKSLHRIGQTGGSVLADITKDPSLAGQSYFDTIGASLKALDEQNQLFKNDAVAYDNLKNRLDSDVKGGTSAIGALANMNEAVLDHIDDLNQKFGTMITNDTAKALKESVEEDQQERSMSDIRKAFANAELPEDAEWDWTKFKPIYTSNHQEQV